MLIESIRIKNFRQFYQEIQIEFSTDSKKNVTVVHGSNGAGKTSLLNAFKWCFYGTTDFDTSNENLLNESAIQAADKGDILDLEIEVRFTHDDKLYFATRREKYHCINSLDARSIGENQLFLQVREQDGQTIQDKTPNKTLKAILPTDLQPYFFFNGERIEHIAGINQSGQVRDAIRKLMGLELVDRAIIHLGKTKNRYFRMLSDEASDRQKLLIEQILSLTEEKERHLAKYNEENRKEEGAKAEVKKIEEKLRRYEKSRDLQKIRDRIVEDITDLESHIESVRKEQKHEMEKHGFLGISTEIFQTCSKIVDENRKKGILPYGIKEQFIDDRIAMERCICGTEIKPDSSEHKCLLEARKNAGTEDIESTYTSVSGLLKMQQQDSEDFISTYQAKAKKLNGLRLTRNERLTELDDVSAQIGKLPDTEISRLEKSHHDQTVISESAVGEKSIALANKNTCESQISDLEQELERLKEQESAQDIASRRLEKVSELLIVTEDLREALSNEVRGELSKKIDNTFQSIIRKDVRAIIDDDYCLQVLKSSPDGEEYVASEQSTGERQVTSLSFISSIISLAREQFNKKGQSFFQGGLYPLVMDSPFGSLDDDYREKVASSVSQLAEQVVIFVSNSQWRGRVKAACEGRVGKSYKLVYHKPNLQGKAPSDYEMPSENEYEYSTIEEIST